MGARTEPTASLGPQFGLASKTDGKMALESDSCPASNRQCEANSRTNVETIAEPASTDAQRRYSPISVSVVAHHVSDRRCL